MKTYNKPNTQGYYGQFGGMFVPPQLESVLKQLDNHYHEVKDTEKFKSALTHLYAEYAGRPSLLYFAERLTKEVGGAKIYLKREDLNHTGAHKINNVVGQGLIAKAMGAKKMIAETGAGQHGVATATIAAYLGMECDIYMGQRDIKNQKPNVYRMKILGAKVIPVTDGQGTLKDAVDAALNAYVQEADSAYYLLGSAVGPTPYPEMVRDFQKVIGEETREQIMKKEGKLPKALIACVGGGSNALGLFTAFIPDDEVELIAVEPAGKGARTNRHGLSLSQGIPGIIHGFKTLVLKDKDGEIKESYSAASGLDYPGVSPVLSDLKEIGRLQCEGATDKEAVAAFVQLSQVEGIIPALESAHALAYATKYAATLSKEDIIVVNLSGRGDKDVENVYENLMTESQK